jgi:hypothetical protein
VDVYNRAVKGASKIDSKIDGYVPNIDRLKRL